FLNSTLPREVDYVLWHALSKEPQSRFASAGDFVTAFEGAFGAPLMTPINRTNIMPPLVPAPPTPPKAVTPFPAIATPVPEPVSATPEPATPAPEVAPAPQTVTPELPVAIPVRASVNAVPETTIP